MRSTLNTTYASLTNEERFKGVKAQFHKSGTITYYKSDNTQMTLRIKKLLNERYNKKIPLLMFHNGVLNVNSGASYRVPTKYHGVQAYSFDKNGSSYWKPAYDMPEQDFRHFSNQEEYEDIYRTNSFLGAFRAKSFNRFRRLITTFNPNTSTAEELLRLGAPKNEFIKISKYDDEFLIDHDNSVYTKEEIENIRKAYNNRDCKVWGHPPGTIYRIEGKDYTVNENWRIKIPEGVICTTARVEIIKPKLTQKHVIEMNQ